ncbi:acyl-CoA dehydrogenase family protein [Nocardia callitridis]|uniref:Acyl-CoA dehydrogenase family protein n=1 Tax=Nocardia callitridis TaxID=648753 RepID=A0ABP9KPI3_9NOCA
MRLPTTEQRDFVSTVEAIAAKHDPLRGVRAAAASRQLDEALWQALVDAGVLEPLREGDVLTACLVAEALGKSAAPVPYLSRSVAQESLSVMGADDPEVWATFGFLGADGGCTARSLDEREGRVDGVLPFVPDADLAQAVVAVVRGDRPCAVVLDIADAKRTPLRTLDLTQPMSSLEFGGAAATVLSVAGTELVAAMNRVQAVGTAIHCAGLVGAMSWLLETTVTYAGQRVQFGQAIATRQAVKHSCAEMLAEVESSRAMVLELADALGDEGNDNDAHARELLVSTVKAFVSDAAQDCASRAFQLHGGIGFTWEHDLHHYFKRCVTGATLFGTATSHRARIARYLRALPTAQ